MMIIRAVYIGNSVEAFVECRFSKGLNIVLSDDNHVGKSVVMQGIMYALGSDPLFSSTLKYKDYYFVVDIEVNGEALSILRQGDTFTVRRGDELQPFDTVAEFTRYWNANIFPLPSIIYNGEDHIVRHSLYNQMFFVSQSDRSSCQISNPGMYKKADFVEMIYSMAGLAGRSLPEDEKEALRAERSDLKAFKERLLKQAKAFNVNDPALSVISPVADEASREEAVKTLDRLTAEITELRKSRNRLYNRMKKNEATLKELRSLNQSITVGRLVCLDCGSQQIGLELADSKTVFDVTTVELRNQIQHSLSSKVASYAEEIESVDEKIRRKQAILADLMEEKDVTIEDVILYREDRKKISEIDDELTKTRERLSEIETLLKSNSTRDKHLQESRASFMEEVLAKMNKAHDLLCLGEEHAIYDKLFTTSAESFTGSELTEYVLSRSYALASNLHHGCPILVDSFRAEDLSTAREEKALKLFNSLDGQIIFTTTLKDEEHDKYQAFDYVNVIDYSGFETNKILQSSYLEEFLNALNRFGVTAMS